MADNFSDAGIFLIRSIAGIYFYIMVLRFLMQVSKVDFYNPLSQTIVKLTEPLARPLRQLLSSAWLATLVAALVVQLVAMALFTWILGANLFSFLYIAWGLLGIFSAILDVYFYALLVYVIASWVAPYSNHPALALVYQITEPVCTPARKLLPPMGGLDFSIMLVLLAIVVLDNFLVVQPLAQYLGAPRGLMLGL